MIHYVEGNILESPAQALVNSVNLEGIMGKGVALQFKKAFPENFKLYVKACKNKTIDVGKLLVTKEKNIFGEKIIINFPTKKTWRKPSEYEYIEAGLKDLRDKIIQYNIKSIAIPPLGCGNGGLIWDKVKEMIEAYLGDMDIDIYLYQPSNAIKEILSHEKVKLTPARALLLDLLYELVKHGEFVSEFSAEKIAYFLQRFGATQYFNLEFKKFYYGPYSGKIRHLLYYLNGSYLKGYSAKDKKPFEPLYLIPEGEKTVKQYLYKNPELKLIADKTKTFLEGFYSYYALELLSTVDFIIQQINSFELQHIKQEVNRWNKRKQSVFREDKHIDLAVKHLQNFLYSKSQLLQSN